MKKRIYLTAILITIVTSICFSAEHIKPTILFDSQFSFALSNFMVSSVDFYGEGEMMIPIGVHISQELLFLHSKSNLGIGFKVGYNQNLSFENIAVPFYIFGSLDRYIKVGVGYSYLSGPDYTGKSFQPVCMASVNYPVIQIGKTYLNALYEIELNITDEFPEHDFHCMSFGFNITRRLYNNLLNRVFNSQYTRSYE